MVAGMVVLSQLCTVLNLPTSRITLNFIRHLPESPLTSSHVKCLQCLAIGFSLQVSRHLMIDGLVLRRLPLHFFLCPQSRPPKPPAWPDPLQLSATMRQRH